MISIKSLTIKNFLSIGNITQSIKFENSEIVLVLGQNIDVGDSGSRNGAGKTSILNALSYALFGLPLNNIKLNNLINKTNHKNMFVTVEFTVGNNTYRIERGRRPNLLRLIVNDETREESDEGQGENRLTQESINNILGFNHVMFKHLIALNTYTEPFLAMRASDQREIIENLLGVTMLSEKAVTLKEDLRQTKDSIKEEEYKIKATENANKEIENTIARMEKQEKDWIAEKERVITNLQGQIIKLKDFDINEELAAHELLDTFLEQEDEISTLQEANKILGRIVTKEKKNKMKTESELESLQNNTCYACGQEVHSEAMIEEKEKALKKINDALTKKNEEIETLIKELKALEKNRIRERPVTRYSTTNDAYQHQSSLKDLNNALMTKENEKNPYREQIEELHANGIKEIDWTEINQLNVLKNHQEFLLKLLTNKNSFVRKRIIEQNLQYLNSRLNYYLIELGLPHEVQFQNDLSVEITELGKDLDFDNLSRGERTRLTLGLSWSFRDVFESMNHPIDFLAVDEILDNGLDTLGLESSFRVLKNFQRARNKNIFLISHKEELVGRVSNILYVNKENGYTSFSKG